MNTKLAVLAATTGIAFATLFASAPPAQAADKTVTIEVGNWNCYRNGKFEGSVSKILIDVVPGTNPAAKWTSGRTTTRNVIYNPSGSKVSITGKAHCKKSWFDPGYYVDIVAGRWVDKNDTSTYWRV